MYPKENGLLNYESLSIHWKAYPHTDAYSYEIGASHDRHYADYFAR